jgi:DNA-binding transcriptional regulator YbjK
MTDRRDALLDAAITLLGEQGIRGVTHRAVDAAAGLPAGSTSNYFRTRDALLNAVVDRFAAREKANGDAIATRVAPSTPAELVEMLAVFARDATGPHRTLTLARYVILVEAAQYPALRARLLATGSRAQAWFENWMRIVGSTDVDRDTPIILNAWTGLVLHELAIPSPAFDPGSQLAPLVAALFRTRHPHDISVEAS